LPDVHFSLGLQILQVEAEYYAIYASSANS